MERNSNQLYCRYEAGARDSRAAGTVGAGMAQALGTAGKVSSGISVVPAGAVSRGVVTIAEDQSIFNLQSDYYGIKDCSTALPRLRLVEDLYEKVVRNRFVYMGAPTASGKTSLLQLFTLYCRKSKVICINVPMLLDYKALLLAKAGIDADTWTLARGVVFDPSKDYVILLDDAHKCYGNIMWWESLIKSCTLPANFKFVISASYSFSTEASTVVFTMLPNLTPMDFRLDENEAREYISLCSVRMRAYRAGPLLVDPVILKLIATNCNGRIGALAMSANEIVERFAHSTTEVTVEDIGRFYLSLEMNFCRCYGTGVRFLPEWLRTSLEKCIFGQRFVAPWENRDTDTEYKKLVRAGIIEESEGGYVKFTSPAAASYINNLIFPHRSAEGISEVKDRGVFELMKAVLRQMSANTLRQSVADPSTDVPSVATFQQLMMAGLQAVTHAACFICPELSKLFPLESQEMEVEGAVDRPPVRGRCDFYLNGGLCWAIEALVNVDGIGEHMSRLESEDGKYAGLDYADYIVVDFRVNAYDMPTNVRRNDRRMCVFFKRGDFRFCNVLCGSGDRETLNLQS